MDRRTFGSLLARHGKATCQFDAGAVERLTT